MPIVAATSRETSVPLCVDLDGTLVRTDVLWETLILLLKRNPLYLLALPGWLLRGRAHFKKKIAAGAEFDAASLPYHQPFLEYLRSEHRHGRHIILATAADSQLANAVARHLGLFAEVFASDGRKNMRGQNKGRALAERFGSKQFDYAGNSTADLPIWREARAAIVVNASEALTRRVRGGTEVSRVFNEPASRTPALVKALRPHQWVKNLIIFVPLITSHKLAEVSLVGNAVLGFIAFSLCASAVYVLNDLWDLDADRRHATKKFRPFASGQLPLLAGFALAPLVLGLSLLLGGFLSWQYFGVLATYFALTTSYSWRIKQIAPLDVFFLAGLYTMRLIAGHTATGIEYSFWLLAFSMFIFLSLALVKRFIELNRWRGQNRRDSLLGRGYTTNDIELVAMLGVASGFLAVLVMALYVNSVDVQRLYRAPIWLLLMCPLLLYWISCVWLLAHRGQMHDDPIVFALKDRASYAVGALALGILWLATGHYSGSQ